MVDHDRRRREIADAVLAVVRRGGVGTVSVRTVADEVGLSVGSLRNTFGRQGDLMAFAMTAVAERVTARVEARATARPPGLEDLADLCGEVLPLDEERRAEAEVWLELVVLARTDAELATVSVAAHEALRRLVAGVVGAVLAGAAAERLELETARLHALLDGLALHGVLHPETFDAAMARHAVRDHLASLAPR